MKEKSTCKKCGKELDEKIKDKTFQVLCLDCFLKDFAEWRKKNNITE